VALLAYQILSYEIHRLRSSIFWWQAAVGHPNPVMEMQVLQLVALAEY